MRSAILTALANHPVQEFSSGEIVLDQGGRTELLFILIEGSVEVRKDGVVVATASEPGAIFGDLAVLLDMPHTAEVRTVRNSKFHVVTGGRKFLEENPPVCLQLCELLARRLDAVNKYLVDVKKQFAGHEHLGLLDGMLDALMHRHPRKRVPPKESTLRDPEVLD